MILPLDVLVYISQFIEDAQSIKNLCILNKLTYKKKDKFIFKSIAQSLKSHFDEKIILNQNHEIYSYLYLLDKNKKNNENNEQFIKEYSINWTVKPISYNVDNFCDNIEYTFLSKGTFIIPRIWSTVLWISVSPISNYKDDWIFSGHKNLIYGKIILGNYEKTVSVINTPIRIFEGFFTIYYPHITFTQLYINTYPLNMEYKITVCYKYPFVNRYMIYPTTMIMKFNSYNTSNMEQIKYLTCSQGFVVPLKSEIFEGISP